MHFSKVGITKCLRKVEDSLAKGSFEFGQNIVETTRDIRGFAVITKYLSMYPE